MLAGPKRLRAKTRALRRSSGNRLNCACPMKAGRTLRQWPNNAGATLDVSFPSASRSRRRTRVPRVLKHLDTLIGMQATEADAQQPGTTTGAWQLSNFKHSFNLHDSEVARLHSERYSKKVASICDD